MFGCARYTGRWPWANRVLWLDMLGTLHWQNVRNVPWMTLSLCLHSSVFLDYKKPSKCCTRSVPGTYPSSWGLWGSSGRAVSSAECSRLLLEVTDSVRMICRGYFVVGQVFQCLPTYDGDQILDEYTTVVMLFLWTKCGGGW